MATEDDNGITPKASNGEPDEAAQREADEVAKKRAAKKAESEAASAAVDQAAIDAMNGKRGNAIDDFDPGEEEEELFPLGTVDGDAKVTLKNIVPGAKARRYEAKMGSTAVPMLNGLVRYGELIRLLVLVEAGAVNEVPELHGKQGDGERTLMGVKDVQAFTPVHVESAATFYSLEQVLSILEKDFGLPRSATKVREVFGLDAPRAAAG